MKKIILLAAILVLILTAAFNSVNAASAQAEERVIVLFKDKVDKDLIANNGGKINRELRNLPAVSISVPSVALQGLSRNPNIELIEKDSIVKVEGQVSDWGIDDVKAPVAWNSGYTGTGVKIAVVDTGISLSHSDLLVAGGASFVAYTNSYNDDNGHGTHVSGIIGARNNDIGTIGVAPDSDLYAVKVLDSSGSGYLSDVIAGIDWAISNQMDIINLSLGSTTDSPTLHQAVDKAYNNGTLVVAAAGNSGLINGNGDTVEYPAKYDSAIAVAAVDSSNIRASFSSTGPKVEVSAPGVSIYSTYLNNGYTKMSGTSMATPYTTGILALLKQQNPALTNIELRDKLDQNVVDLGATGRDTLTGYGLIQAQAQPVESNKAVISVTTDKDSYLKGETVTVEATVKDSNLIALNGATVNLTITSPSGNQTNAVQTTDSSGTVVFNISTNRKTKTGTYNINVQSSLSGYSSSNATTQYSIK